VTFASPGFLAALLLVPLAVVVYVRLERGRRRQSEAFATAGMLDSVAPVRPGWRRHAPMWL
jgi:Ca-activated chloride channel homolog